MQKLITAAILLLISANIVGADELRQPVNPADPETTAEDLLIAPLLTQNGESSPDEMAEIQILGTEEPILGHEPIDELNQDGAEAPLLGEAEDENLLTTEETVTEFNLTTKNQPGRFVLFGSGIIALFLAIGFIIKKRVLA